MKKLVIAVAAAAMMFLGLGTAPAQAGPYTGTVATTTNVTAVRTPAVRGAKAVVRTNVRPTSGSAKVKGAVQLVCRYNKTGYRRAGARVSYKTGGTVRLHGPKLHRKGAWTCAVRYFAGERVFKASHSKRFTIRVR